MTQWKPACVCRWEQISTDQSSGAQMIWPSSVETILLTRVSRKCFNLNNILWLISNPNSSEVHTSGTMDVTISQTVQFLEQLTDINSSIPRTANSAHSSFSIKLKQRVNFQRIIHKGMKYNKRTGLHNSFFIFCFL